MCPLPKLHLEDGTGGVIACLNQKLVTGLVVGDVQLAVSAANELTTRPGAAVSSKVYTPFGGSSLYPLQAAVTAPLHSPTVAAICRLLLNLGASPNILWADLGGCHTPLSRALVVHNMQLAQLFVDHGADCTAALLRTDLLERSRFDPALVRWLVDRGADAGTPLPRGLANAPSCSLLACQVSTPAGAAGPCASRCCCPAVPPVGVLLSKLSRELHVSRQLSKLHAAAGTGQEAWLLRRAADCLQLLLAAGAAPAGAPDASGTVAAAVGGMVPSDWTAIEACATQPPEWSPGTHHLFPQSFKIAAREVLFVASRGFRLPTSRTSKCSESGTNSENGSGASGSSRHAPGSSGGGISNLTSSSAIGSRVRPRSRQAGQHEAQKGGNVWWLDGGIVLCILKQLAPSTQHLKD